MKVSAKMSLYCIIVLTMVTTCYNKRVEQTNNPDIESFTERRFSTDEFQDLLFDEVHTSHRLPRAIAVQRPNIIGHSNPIHRTVQNHVKNGGGNRFAMLPRRRPVQDHVEDEGDDHFDPAHPRRPKQNPAENEDDDVDDDDHPSPKLPRRPTYAPACPCPCGSNSYFVCPAGCKHYGYCPSCPCPCSRYDIDNPCPFGCRPRDTCDSLWK